MAVLKLLDSEMEDVEVASDPLLGKVAKGAAALRCVNLQFWYVGAATKIAVCAVFVLDQFY